MLATMNYQPSSDGLFPGGAQGEVEGENGNAQSVFHSGNGSNSVPRTEKEPSKRKKYLKILGFRQGVDPFLNPVAEQEIERAGDIAQFFSYYYSPDTESSGALNIERLRASQHSFIYGNPGDGKTTLRLILDASCRTRPDQTLVVNYLLDKLVRPLSPDEHADRLAQALAVDFLLQWIEQASKEIDPAALANNPAYLTALARQIQWSGTSFQEWLKTLLEEATGTTPESESSRMGLGIYWGQVSRYAVQYVAMNTFITQLLADGLRQAARQAFEKPAGMAAMWQGLRDAKTWGFRQAFVLVDGVDTRLRDTKDMEALVTPLLSILPEATRNGLWLKLFIPQEIQPGIDGWCKLNLPPGLYSACLNATINWNQSALKQLLIKRFRTAGSQMISSLDELADSELPVGLEQPVIEMANGSPRTLLELVSKLIQVHAERASDQIQINQSDLDKLKKAV